MKPFVEEGRLLERSYEQLSNCLDEFVTISLDNRIVACAGLRLFDEKNVGEIYALAVDKDYHNKDISKKLMEQLINKAEQLNLNSVFALSKFGGHFFHRHHFIVSDITSLPLSRQKSYDYQRKSIIYLKKL